MEPTPECQVALQTVEDVMAQVREQHRLLDEAVAAARAAGATWEHIGEAAGMTRQSAHERWGYLVATGCPRPGCGCVEHHPEAGRCGCGHGPGRGRGRRRWVADS